MRGVAAVMLSAAQQHGPVHRYGPPVGMAVESPNRTKSMLAIVAAATLAASPQLDRVAHGPRPPRLEPRSSRGRPQPPAPRPLGAEQPKHTGPIAPVYLSFGIGGLFLFGDAEPGVAIGEVFSNQVNIGVEGGLRLSRHLALALYADFGAGEEGRAVAAVCDTFIYADCNASTTRVGLMLRHTFDPSARVTPWIGVGAGLAFGRVSFPSGSGTSGGTPGLIEEYAGWELLRLQGGFDVRSTPVFGVGVLRRRELQPVRRVQEMVDDRADGEARSVVARRRRGRHPHDLVPVETGSLRASAASPRLARRRWRVCARLSGTPLRPRVLAVRHRPPRCLGAVPGTVPRGLGASSRRPPGSGRTVRHPSAAPHFLAVRHQIRARSSRPAPPSPAGTRRRAAWRYGDTGRARRRRACAGRCAGPAARTPYCRGI